MQLAGFSSPNPLQHLAPSASQRGSAQPLSGNVLQFSGKAVEKAGKNGLWITTELAPYAIVGGLGQVSETIPDALNRYLDKDVRVMVPLLAPMKNHPDFQPTGQRVALKTPLGRRETFELYERNIPGKPVVYAIANDTFFGNHPNIYFPGQKSAPKIGQDAIFKSLAMFNRAAAHFAQQLYPGPEGTPKNVTSFDGALDFVMIHDHLTSSFLNELPAEMRDNLGNVFMLHNTFNEQRSLETALKKNHLSPPPFRADQYSPLALGIHLADSVVANRNYAYRVAHELNATTDYAQKLRGKQQHGQVFDMHHGLSDRYNPQGNPALQKEGFVELEVSASTGQPTLKQLKAFKAANKQALQEKWGLTPDPDGVVYSWVARPDPFQKGFYLLMDVARQFLTDNPQAQLLIAGPVPGKAPAEVEAFMQAASEDPDLQGRIVFPGFTNVEGVAQINAGSDFLILPSLYEPYGLSQLEAMKLGCIPIVHGVDGLRSTISDPDMNQRTSGEPEIAWDYGQTGIMMKPLDVPGYWQRLNKIMQHRPLNNADQAFLNDARSILVQALDRGLALTSDVKQATRVRQNGMRYVEEQHPWESIAPRYQAPIDAAIHAAKQRAKAREDLTA